MTQLSNLIELFHPLDRLTAKAIVQDSDSALFFLFCYVSCAYRAGHLFVHLVDNQIHPLPHTIIDDEEAQNLQEILLEGFLSLQETKHPMYVFKDGRLYLRRAYEITASVKKEYERLQNAQCRATICFEHAQRFLQDAVVEKKLLVGQAQAILQALKTPIATIWGGPGTGKTYTAGMLLHTLLSCRLSHTPCRIALCAPTAKATQQVQRSIQAFCSNEGLIEAKTLHALLELRPFGYKRPIERELAYDVVLVDESSMIDAALFERLLRRLSSGTRLILLGDPDQLPPVEPGACFSHIVQCAQGKCVQDTRTKLDRCMRAELEGIVSFAALIRDGKKEEALAFASSCCENSGVCVSFVSEKDFEASIDEHLVAYKNVHLSNDPQSLFSQFLKMRFLSPMRLGKFGVATINTLIQKKVAQDVQAIPIMVCQNDYELALANGQIGILIDDTVYFETGDGMRALPRVLLRAYEPAWCLSVHKSQGSEFDEVIVFLPPGSERFGRKMLYTAITRAKKKVHLYTSQEVFLACIAQDSIRNTNFFQLP